MTCGRLSESNIFFCYSWSLCRSVLNDTSSIAYSYGIMVCIDVYIFMQNYVCVLPLCIDTLAYAHTCSQNAY